MRLSTLTAFLTLTAALAAQFPLGHGTPVNGYSASLFSQPIWLGNPGYSYDIKGAPPGGTALVAVSGRRQDQDVGGLAVYVDLPNVGIIHQGTVDAGGHATLPFPLGFPDDPALIGLQLYAQAAVTDPTLPGSVGTTQAVLIEITAHPLLAVVTPPGVWLIDPVAASITTLAGLPANVGVKEVLFGNGGRDLFVSTVNGLYVADTLAPAPQAVFMAPNTNWQQIAWDRIHRRLYAVDNFSIAVFDGNRSSPTFGSLLLQIPAIYNAVDVSTDGSTIVFGGGTIVTRCDGNPASPTYLQQILLPPLPAGTTNAGWPRVHVSADGRIVSHFVASLWSTPPLAINRFDMVTGSWIDHDPVTPGTQPISATSHPALATNASIYPSRDGSAWIFAQSNAVGRIELDLNVPSNVTVTSTSLGTTYGNADFCGITPSTTFLVKKTSLGWTSVALSFVYVATGGEVPWVTLPSAASPVLPLNMGWR